jgi:5-methylcytosine-specific restriction endonuclease McrA
MWKGLSGWKSLDFDSYEEYLLSSYWQEKKNWILECFEWKCKKCGRKENLNVHHKNYDSVGNENLHDVTVLCNKCHKEEHGK